MSLHYSRDGYTFRADAGALTIEPGKKSLTLNRAELDQIGLRLRGEYQIPLATEGDTGAVIDGILSALDESLKRCSGPENAWMAMNLRRAMVLVGGLDEKVAHEILDQEGV